MRNELNKQNERGTALLITLAISVILLVLSSMAIVQYKRFSEIVYVYICAIDAKYKK